MKIAGSNPAGGTASRSPAQPGFFHVPVDTAIQKRQMDSIHHLLTNQNMCTTLAPSGTFGMSAGLGSGRSSRGCSSLMPLPVSGPAIRGLKDAQFLPVHTNGRSVPIPGPREQPYVQYTTEDSNCIM